MTVAQLVYPAHSLAQHSRRAIFGALHDSAVRHLSRDLPVWRSIGVGIAFAAAGFAMMAGAFAG